VRYITLRHLALSLASAVLLIPSHAAAEAWEPIPADLKGITDCAKEPGCPAAILQEDVFLDNEYGHAQVRTHRIIKIFKPEGLAVASVKLEYYVGDSGITEIEGRTLRADGSTVRLDPSKAIDETVAKVGLLYRHKLRSFEMPGAEVGAILEYRFKRVYSSQIGYFRWDVQADYPLLNATMTVAPGPVGFRSYPPNLPGVQVASGQDAKGRGQTSLHNVPSFKEEPLMPPESVTRGAIILYPLQPWWNHHTVAVSFRRDVEQFLGRSSKTKKQAKSAVGEATAPVDKAERIYRYIQDNLRNDSYQQSAEGTTTTDAPVRFADEVLAAGGGTPSDLARVFVGMAREVGLEAEIAWVVSRDQAFLNLNTFRPGDVSEELAAVKIDGTWAYYDPGTPYCPFGMVTWEKDGAIGNNGIQPQGLGGILVRVPSSKAVANLRRRSVRMDIDPDGTLTAEVDLEYQGLAGAEKRNELDHRTPEERRKQIEDDLKARFTDAEVVEATFDNLWQWAEPLRGHLRVRIPGYAGVAGSRLLIPMFPFLQGEGNPFPAATRQHPIYFERPYRNLDEVTIHMPTGYTVESLPSNRRIDLQAIRYLLRASQEGEDVKMERELLVDAVLVEVSRYSVVRNLFEEKARLDGSELVLRLGGEGAAAAEGSR